MTHKQLGLKTTAKVVPMRYDSDDVDMCVEEPMWCPHQMKTHFIAQGSNMSNLGLRFLIKQVVQNTRKITEHVGLSANK